MTMTIAPHLFKSSVLVALVIVGCMMSTIVYQRNLIHTLANSVTTEDAFEVMPEDSTANRELTPPKEVTSPSSFGTITTMPAAEKPLFILHIGPPKTGTTTLQCELGLKYRTMTEENFYYLGTWYPPLCGLPQNYTIDGFSDATRPVLLHCYAKHAKSGCDLEHHLDQEWKKFADILHPHKKHNVIMSDEMFHHHFQREDVERLAKLLLPHWNVRILFTYRHFYQAVPSMYHQLNDPYAIQPGMAHAYEKTIWPADGGYKIQSFQRANYFKIDREMERFQFWVDYFPQAVHVFKMNVGGNFLQEFLCTMMPEVKSLCMSSNDPKGEPTKEESSKENDSSSKYLRYDMLAVQAQEEGLLDHTELGRITVRDAVQRYCEDKGWTDIEVFPLECLDEPLKEIFLQQSLKQARIMQPYFVSPPIDVESEIRAGFAKFEAQHKFCSVDVKQALEEGDWRLFFQTL
jgi:hypothetical protein